MEALKGLRVSGIPDQTSVMHLQEYFSNHSLSGGGPIADIVFPVLGNEAVIFFHTQTDATSVMSRTHQIFKVKPLPHQVFASVEATLDPGMTALVATSQEHQRCLLDRGLKLKLQNEELVVGGNTYELEYAWAYLHGVLDKQCLIQDHLLGRGEPLSSSSTTAAAAAKSAATTTALDLGQSLGSSNSSSAASTPRRSRPPSGKRKDDSSKSSATALVNGHEDSAQLSPRATNSTKSSHKTSGAGSKSSSPAPRPKTVESPSPRLSSQHPQPASRDAQQRDLALSLSPDSPETMPKSLMASDFLDQEASTSTLIESQSQRPQPAPRTTVADRIAESSYLGELHHFDPDPVSIMSEEGSPARRHDAEETFNHFVRSAWMGSRSEEDRAAENHVRSRTKQGDTRGGSGERDSSLRGPASLQTSGGAGAAGDTRQTSLTSSSKDKLTLDVGSGVKVNVYLGDITKVKTEGVVNAANSELRNWSGVAGALLKAAGPRLKEECEEYIRRRKILHTSQVTHTGAGNMINVMYILHTVGPIFLSGSEAECLYHLQKTFYNCLTYANSRRLRSISFPYISTGVFGVPLEICVRAFLGAVLLFVMDVVEANIALKQVDLVHNDLDVVRDGVAMLQELMEKEGKDAVLAKALSYANLQENLSPRDYLPRAEEEPSSRGRDYSSLSALDRKRSSSLSHGSKKKSSSDLDYKMFETSPLSGIRGDTDLSERNHPTPSPRSRSSSLDRRRPSSEGGARPKTSASSSSTTSAAASTRPSTSHPLGHNSKYRSSDLNLKGSSVAKKSGPGSGSSTPRGQPMKAFAADHEGDRSPLSKTSYLDKYSSALTSGSHRTDNSNDYLMHSLPADPSKLRKPLFDQCPICLDDMVRSKKLQCGHEFCRSCIDKAFQTKPVCPTCNKVFGPLKGDQPRGGRMVDTIEPATILPGYTTSPGAIVIRYSIPSGRQESHHPNPGRYYEGVERTAYLPNNTEGREVLRLLKKAFDAGLIFTISDSRTSGAEGVITWAEIHHKTKTYGGSTHYGYPDPTYLKRVKEELAAKGITS